MIRCALSNEPFWCLWGLFPGWAQWGLVIGVLLVVSGVVWRLITIAKSFGGWPAAIGAVGIAGILIAVIWPKRRTPDETFPHPDGEPTHPRKKSRPTIFDKWR